MGLVTLFTAIPVGYVADKVGRSKIISFGGVCMIIASVLTIVLVLWIDDASAVKTGF